MSLIKNKSGSAEARKSKNCTIRWKNAKVIRADGRYWQNVHQYFMCRMVDIFYLSVMDFVVCDKIEKEKKIVQHKTTNLNLTKPMKWNSSVSRCCCVFFSGTGFIPIQSSTHNFFEHLHSVVFNCWIDAIFTYFVSYSHNSFAINNRNCSQNGSKSA